MYLTCFTNPRDKKVASFLKELFSTGHFTAAAQRPGLRMVLRLELTLH